MTGYFSPLNTTDGIQRFNPDGEAGWYQMPGPTATLDELPGITLPEAATGVLVQATGGTVSFCSSPEATALLAQGMELADGDAMFISGATAMRQLCFLLDGVASITFQFYTGAIGPTPIIS